MFLITHFFTIFIYQPFFNLLVFFYWLLGLGGGVADMGVAVIILSIIVRIILLPVSLAGDRTEAERREINAKLAKIEKDFAHEPIRLKQEYKKILRGNKRIIFSEILNLGIQMMVALMLWRVFETGLEGKDLHLIYNFMPKIKLPFNLMFLGKYDLSRPNIILNLLQSFLIFLFETVLMLTSTYKVERKDVIRLQFTLPLVSFLIFMFMPSGKKLFIITSLIFSILLVFYKTVKRTYNDYKRKAEEKELAKASGEKIETIVS